MKTKWQNSWVLLFCIALLAGMLTSCAQTNTPAGEKGAHTTNPGITAETIESESGDRFLSLICDTQTLDAENVYTAADIGSDSDGVYRFQVECAAVTETEFHAVVSVTRLDGSDLAEDTDPNGDGPVLPFLTHRYLGPCDREVNTDYSIRVLETPENTDSIQYYDLRFALRSPVTSVTLTLKAMYRTVSEQPIKPVMDLSVTVPIEFPGEKTVIPEQLTGSVDGEYPGSGMSALFGNGMETNREIVAPGIGEHVASVEAENLRLTVEGILSDNHRIFVVYSIEALDGSDISHMVPDSSWYLDREWINSCTSMYECLGALEGKNHRIFMMHYFRSDSSVDSVRFDLAGLVDPENEENTIPCALSVQVAIPKLPYVTGTDPEGKFWNIAVSPIGLWVEFHETSEDGAYNGVPLHNVYLQFRDGSQKGMDAEHFANESIRVDRQAYLGWGYAEQRLQTGGISCIEIPFTEYIRLEELESLVIDGTVIPLHIP